MHTDPVVVRFKPARFVIHKAVSNIVLAMTDVRQSLYKTSERGGSVHSTSGKPTSSATFTHRQIGGRYQHDDNKKGWCGVHLDESKRP